MIMPRRRTDLISQPVADECALYDPSTDEAFSLNPSLTIVWRHCDGQTATDATVQQLMSVLNLQRDEALDVLSLALAQLEEKNLVAGSVDTSIPRRSLMRAGLQAVLPLLMVISVGRAAVAQSLICNGAACTCANANSGAVCANPKVACCDGAPANKCTCSNAGSCMTILQSC